jgi:DNA-binding MarR family transcriptional regulator
MLTLDISFLVFGVGFSVQGVIFVLLYRWIKTKVTPRNDDQVIGYLVSSLEGRLKEEDSRIAELVVKVDILENRIVRQFPDYHQNLPQFQRLMESSLEKQTEVSFGQEQSKSTYLSRKKSLGSSEKVILSTLLKSDLTAAQVMNLLRCTREHASRMMKSLYDRKLVNRIGNGKPFLYRITDDGRKYVEQIN